MTPLLTLVVVLAALAQVVLAPLTILGVLPLIAMLIIAWLAYRYGGFFALPLMLIAGFVLSFFVLAPTLLILAYGLAGVVVVAGVYVTTYDDRMSTYGSILVIAFAALCLQFVADFTSLPSLSFLTSITYLLLTAAVSAGLWSMMLLVARPQQ